MAGYRESLEAGSPTAARPLAARRSPSPSSARPGPETERMAAGSPRSSAGYGDGPLGGPRSRRPHGPPRPRTASWPPGSATSTRPGHRSRRLRRGPLPGLGRYLLGTDLDLDEAYAWALGRARPARGREGHRMRADPPGGGFRRRARTPEHRPEPLDPGRRCLPRLAPVRDRRGDRRAGGASEFDIPASIRALRGPDPARGQRRRRPTTRRRRRTSADRAGRGSRPSAGSGSRPGTTSAPSTTRPSRAITSRARRSSSSP